jgi:hypothetical protein
MLLYQACIDPLKVVGRILYVVSPLNYQLQATTYILDVFSRIDKTIIVIQAYFLWSYNLEEFGYSKLTKTSDSPVLDMIYRYLLKCAQKSTVFWSFIY